MAKELPKNLKKQIEDSSQNQQTKNLVERKYGTLTKNQEYWKERSERRILEAEKTADEITKDLKVLYADTIELINKEIEALFGRYQTETGLTMEELRKLLTPDELKKFRAEALKYYENLSKYAYDPSYRERLKNQIYTTTTKEDRKLYSLRRNVSRLDYLKMQIENAIETLYAKEYTKITRGLQETYKETYMRSMFDTQQAVGVFTPFNVLNEKLVNKAVQQKWLGDNYSDRIWSDKNKLINTLETTFVQDIALGKNPKAIASDIKKETGVKYRNCERLARTEFNHIANQATMDCYKQTGLEKYKYIATLDSRTSEICFIGSDKIQTVSDVEKLFKRNYTGKIITITTASGNQITGTPNHPILTSGGWLPLDKINPNEHIVYSIFNKSVGIISEKNVNVPTEIAKLFNSISKISTFEIGVSSTPATKLNNNITIDNSKIDILNINGILRDWRKTVIDKHIIKDFFTFIHNSIYLFCFRQLFKLLKTTSPIIKTPEIEIFSFSEFIKPTLRPTKFFNDNTGANAIVKHINSCSSISKIIDIVFTSFKSWHNPIFFKKICKSSSRNRIFFCKFRSGYTAPVFTDNVISKRVEFANNCHVYNLQTNDNTYINNNIIVHNCASLDNKVFLLSEAEEGVNYPEMHPNCRSTTIPYLEDLDYSKIERIATDPETGRAYYVPSNMTYGDWKNSLTEEQGRYFVANQKMSNQYKEDVKQVAQYRKLVTEAKKQGNSELFEGFPTKVKDFQQMKYLEPEKWEIYKENAKIVRNQKD